MFPSPPQSSATLSISPPTFPRHLRRPGPFQISLAHLISPNGWKKGSWSLETPGEDWVSSDSFGALGPCSSQRTGKCAENVTAHCTQLAHTLRSSHSGPGSLDMSQAYSCLELPLLLSYTPWKSSHFQFPLKPDTIPKPAYVSPFSATTEGNHTCSFERLIICPYSEGRGR